MLKSQKELQEVFNIVLENGGGEIRQVRLYSRLTCGQKRRKCKFVPRLLSVIADARSSRFAVAVVSYRSVFHPQARQMGRFCI